METKRERSAELAAGRCSDLVRRFLFRGLKFLVGVACLIGIFLALDVNPELPPWRFAVVAVMLSVLKELK
jgi:hypothetical protein